MLWSLIKIFIFIAIAAGLAFGVAWILETPGEVVIAFAGREWSLTPIGSLIALVVLLVAAVVILKVLGFIIALSGVDPDTASDVSAVGPMVSVLISGMSIALYTTLVGSVLNVWLMMNYRLLETGTVHLLTQLIDRAEQAHANA